MNRDILYVNLTLYILIISLLLILLFNVVKIYRSILLEKRITKFSLKPLSEENSFLFDRLYLFILLVVSKFSKLLIRSKLLKKWGENHDKHITSEDNSSIKGIDYISIKILTGALFLFSHLALNLIVNNNFNILMSISFFLLGFFTVSTVLYIKYNGRRTQIENELLNAVITMNNAFKSGKNIPQAIEVVAQGLNEPIASEFKRISTDISYGLSLEVAFDRFYNRVKTDDAKYIKTSLSILNKTGGDITKVFSAIEKQFLARKRMKSELTAATSASKLVFRILIFLPFVFGGLIFILNPDYFKPLYTTGIGVLMAIFIIGLFSLYIFLVKKTLEVRV